MPRKNSPPDTPVPLSAAAQAEIARVVAGGLGDLSLREILAASVNALSSAERSVHLKQSENDRGNGFYQRGLNLGSMPVDIAVPRVRSGAFRPSILPGPYKRGYTDEDQALFLGLLSASRSIGAAKSALKKMGLSASESDLDAVAKEYAEIIALKNTAAIDPDMIALFIDAKVVEIRDDDRIRPACIYVVVGLRRDGTKRVLCCQCIIGRESLDNWKKVLRSLLERGLRRVLCLVQDDFSGLLKLTSGLFPQSDIQLCVVHMQRNAKVHLPKADIAEFMARIRTIKACWNIEAAAAQFDELCETFADKAPTFIQALRKKRDHYLKFMSFPLPIRRSFSTTNAVETLNGQLERMRRNNGGYFHSEAVLSLKLGITIDYLEQGSWRRPAGSIVAVLPQLNALFEKRFEHDD
jgi:putative transposase